jgi:uncharacterized protein (TIGR02996 family)
VLADPNNDDPRTDWLAERGDPRGEFIAVQCELARKFDFQLAVRSQELRRRTDPSSAALYRYMRRVMAVLAGDSPSLTPAPRNRDYVPRYAGDSGRGVPRVVAIQAAATIVITMPSTR